MVQGEPGVRLENLVACALLKELHRARDVDGEDLGLHYVRDKDGREIDFLITRNGRPWRMIEVEWKDAVPSANLKRFLTTGTIHRLQVVGDSGAEQVVSGRSARRAGEAFSGERTFRPGDGTFGSTQPVRRRRPGERKRRKKR